MSRITGREVSELMEAYQAIYAPQEEVVEEIVEEDTEQNAEVFDEKMDVFSAIGNTPSPVFTKPQQQPRKGMGGAIDRGVADASKAAALKFFTKGMQPAGGRPATPGTPARPAAPARPGTPSPAASAPRPAGQTVAAAGGKGGTVTVGTKYAATLGGQKGSVTYDAAGKKTFTADKPAAAKPAPSAAPRPGTQAAGPESIKPKTPNPLMQKTFGYQTGNAPDQIAKASAGAPPTPSGSALGAAAKPEVRSALNLPSKPAASLSQAPEVKKTAEIAKKPVQPAVAPTSTQMRQGTFREEVDAYDLVLDYLLENGHADTVDEAHYVMLEMDSEMIQNIAEAKRKSYSAKKARRGEDLGLPGPGFEKIATEAGKRYGSKERGEKVAGAVLKGLRAKHGK